MVADQAPVTAEAAVVAVDLHPTLAVKSEITRTERKSEGSVM
jgi:hypothetical protein